MNRHAPRSAIAPDPKQHKYCRHCKQPIVLQRPKHNQCNEQCTHLDHHPNDEEIQTITRYWDDEFNEMCEECALKPADQRMRHGI